MKIAMVLPGGAGGGVRSVTRVAAGLIERGHDVLLLYLDPPRSLRERLRGFYLGLRYGQNGSWLRSFPGRSRPYEQLTAKVVGRNDVVIGVGVDCALAIADLPGECGLKVHNSRGMEPWIGERMERAWALPMPRIVTGAHLVQQMRRRGSQDPIYVAHNGVDRDHYYPALPETRRDGVGTVYHGGSVKNPELILEVLNRIDRQRPAVPLYVFGVFPRPKQLPDSARYARFPQLPVAREFYSRSQVWFLASRNEGLGNPVLEAMACGGGVVSTDCGGPGDIITSGVNGFLTPVGEADQMTASILQLLDDQALRRRFVQASAPILERFSWPKAIDSFETALQDIVAGRQSRHNCPQTTGAQHAAHGS